jgi:trk system potassium uptake protein TrkH
MVQDVDHMSMADNMWRFTMQFLGGQGVVVIALSMGLFSKAGSQFYNAEGRDEAIVPNIKKTAIFIMRFSIAVIAVGALILMVAAMLLGMDPLRSFFHGMWIAIGSFDTGGFAPQSLNIMYYHSWVFEVLAMLLMLLGAVNFSLFAFLAKGDWREFFRDIEIRTLALWITGMVVVFVAALVAGSFLTDYVALARRGIFTIISATTNTGYQVLSTEQMTTMFTSGAFFLIAISMAIGGSATSTAGGIKALRVGLIAKGIGARIKAVLLPQSARSTMTYHHIGRHPLTGELLSTALIIAALYVITYVLGALLAVAFGYEALPATFEAISAASNAGLSAGIVSPEAPVVLKIFYILAMWMGRLEFITLLALFASIIVSIIPRRRVRITRMFRRGEKVHDSDDDSGRLAAAAEDRET